MPNFIIKTHQKSTECTSKAIFILNKGMNSGKPQKEEFANSFVILFEREEDAEIVYWLAYSLWKSNFWHQFLIGSVIPFLRITDFKKSFILKTTQMLQEHEVHKKQILALRLLEQKEDQLHKNMALINEMRRIIVLRYSK